MINQPSISPPDFDSLTGTFAFIFRKLMEGVGGPLPAKVISYDRPTNRAVVQPTINVLGTSGEQVPRAEIKKIPVLFSGAGGFILRFNLNPGDLGWIIPCDRDISLFLQSYTLSKPNTLRIKDYADSFFLPDPMTGYTISEDDATNAVLQSLDGSIKISLGTSKIEITAPTVEINTTNANIVADQCEISAPTVTIEADTGVNMTTPLLYVDGNIAASGTITPGVLNSENVCNEPK